MNTIIKFSLSEIFYDVSIYKIAVLSIINCKLLSGLLIFQSFKISDIIKGIILFTEQPCLFFFFNNYLILLFSYFSSVIIFLVPLLIYLENIYISSPFFIYNYDSLLGIFKVLFCL